MATITGTSGNDTIIDGSGADTILGLAGNDSLSGNGGDDILRGGTGNDMIDGGSGADLIDFSDATGGINFTLVQSSSSTNVNLTGVGLGTDSYKNIEGVIATNFNDTLIGSTLNDVLSGGGGNDILRGRAGNDTIDGGSGTDLIDFSDATGGINFTLVQSSSSTSVNLSGVGLGTDAYKNIEGVIGTNFTDTLSGSSNADTIYGGGGNDTILGGSGNDILRGGAGNDTIDGGSGIDLIDFSDATGGITFTLVQSSSSTSVNLSGVGLGTDTYKNTEGVVGTNFADILTGSGNADTIYGQGGNDTIVGGLGGDLLTGGSGLDVFVVTTNNSDTVSDSLYATGAPIASPFTSVRPWDIITDFSHDEDKLDLSQLNTRLTGAGPSVLQWLGERGTDAEAGTSNASRAHGVWTNTDHTFIYADIDGGGQADMKIQVSNVDGSDLIGVNRAPNITVGSGDRATASLSETNEGLSTSGKLTVVDADLTDRVSPSVQSVVLSGVTGGLAAADVLSMLKVPPSPIAADPGAASNLDWVFNSGTAQAFDFLAASEQLKLTYTLRADDGRGGSDTQAVAITITGTNDAPSITVGAGDRAAASLTETNAGLSTSGELTVVDADLTDRVSPSVQSVVLSGVTGGLAAADVLSMLKVPPSPIAADPGAASNLDWVFNSGTAQAFDFLAAGEQLTLTYTLKADDGRGGSDTQAVAITINGTNDAPNITVGAGDRAAASLTETNAGLSTRGDLTVVDADLTDRVRPSVQSVELSGVTGGLTADVLSMLTVSPGSIGANPGAANNLHWKFDADAQAFDFLAAGEQLTLTYTLKADDSHAGSDTQTVAITINGTNDAPVGVNDSASATEKGGTSNTSGGSAATGNVIANDTDVDGGGLAVSAIRSGSTEGAGTVGTLGAGLAGAHGTLTLAGDGSYTYVIDESDVAVQALNSGESLSDSFNYTVQDSGGRTDTATLTISINGANDAPVGVDDSASATEKGGTGNTSPGSAASGSVLANDTDVDSAGLTVSAIRSGASEGTGDAGTLGGATAGAHGTLTLADDGSYTYVVNDIDAAVQALNDGDTLSDSFNYTVQDGGGLSDTAVLTISIHGANDAPDISVGEGDDTAAALIETNMGLSASGDLTVVDADLTDAVSPSVQSVALSGVTGGLTPDDVLSMLTVSPPSIAADPGAAGNLHWAFDSDVQAFDFLADGEQLTLSYTLKVDDGHGGSDTQAVDITITGSNDAPSITVGAGDGAAAALTETNARLSTSGDLTVVDADLTDAVSPSVQSVALSGVTGGLTPDDVLSMLTVSPPSIAADPGAAGNLHWAFDSDVQAFNFLADGEQLTLSYTLKAADGHGGSDTQTVDITITGSNDAPDISVGEGDDAAAALTETNTGLSASGKLTVVDVDLTDTVSASVQSVVLSGITGALTSEAVGTMLTVSPSPIAADPDAAGNLDWAFNSGEQAFDFLADGEQLTLSYTLKAADGHGGSDTQAVDITIHGTNDAPLGVNDSASATEKGGTSNTSGGSAATGNVLGNDTDVDSAGLTVSAIRSGASEGTGDAGTLGGATAGAHGTLTLAADGSYTYVIDESDAAVQALNSGDTLSDSFNYTVQDTGGLMDTATLTISIAGANDAPVGENDISASAGATAGTEKGGTLNGSVGSDATGNVIANDTDVDSDGLTVSAIRSGSTEGAGTAGTLGVGLAGTHGTLTLGADGGYTYVIDDNDAAVQALNSGDTLSDSFNYTVQDAGGLTDTATLTISINGTNDAPVGVNDTSASAGATAGTEKGGTFNGSGGNNATGNVISNDTDVDNGGLTVSAIRSGSTEGAGTAGTLGVGLAGTHGTLTLAADGSYTYAIDESDAAVQALNSGDTLSDSFNYTVQDAGGLSDTATLTISINGANDAPVGVDDSAGATEKGGTDNTSGGNDATGNVITTGAGTDSDVDNTSGSLLVSQIRTGSTEGAGTAGTLSEGLAGAHGTLTLAGDGSYTYVIDENDAAVQALNSGEALSDTFNYTVQDAGGLTDTAVLTISIAGANDAPVGVDDSGSATEKSGTNNTSGGSDATGNVIANDPDVDSGGLTVSAIRSGSIEGAGTAGTLGAGLAGAHGTLTLADDGSYTYVVNDIDAAVQALNDGDTLSDSFNYTVQDGGGLSDTAVLTISIHGANDAPTMTSGATASTPENVSTATAVYTATAIDPDGPALTYSFGGGVDDSKFSIDGSSGAVTFKVSPNFESPSDSDANNVYDIIVKASDGTLFDTKAVTIAVTNVNEAPTAVADIVLTTAGSGATFSIPEAALLANDTDPDSLSLDVAVGSVGAATSGTVAHVAGTGSFGSIRFTDDTAAAGSFQYAATDGSLVGVSATVSITNAFTTLTGGIRVITGTGSDEILIGRAGTDNLNGAGGNDVIVGAGGGDTLTGGAGNDSIVYTVGASAANPVIIHGDATAALAGTDSDTLVLTDAASITLSASNQTAASFTTVTGFENVDASRSDAAVILRGSSGANTLIGGSGADGIFGGNGADNLTGGAGADTFVYTAVSNSNNSGFDTITDFTSGSDTIQLTAGITASQGALATATSSVAAHSVAWFLDVANNQTIVYGNPTDGALSAGSAGLGEVHLANTLTLTGGDFVFEALPAGIAGEPIVLALTNPSSDANVQIAVNVSGVPSGWGLNAGTNNGDGTWTVHTNDPSALTVTTAAGFVGATVLTVTETWTNADGSPGHATVLDNVETYAPGSPIFAVSTDDHLTGSTGEDLFVFAQPIATDTIDNFDAAADKIDLIGFAGFTSFADLAIANDANGNAVITLGASSQITVLGIDAASLTAGNFEFDVRPVITNIDTITISDGAILPLGGTIENKGTIALDSSGNDTYLQILFRDATLTGGGQVVMSDSDQNVIVGGSGDTALVNHDNIITGAGHLGAGQLTLINGGTIIADGSHALVIDTGSYAATNSGTMEATGIGGLVVESALENTGSLWANGGNIILHGDVTGAGSATISGAATLEFGAASDANVAFADGAAGMLKLDVSEGFTGTVSGFAAGDSIDLSDVVYAGGMQLSYTANDAGTGGTLIVSDGTHSAHITLMGQYQAAGVQADGQGGTLLAFDAPAVDHNMTGGAGSDALTGGNSNDTLTGGAGVDMLTGGLGDDLFDYNAVSDSGVGAGHRDVIADFQAHADAMANHDAIDLSGIDAITGGNDDAFAFVANGNPAVNPGVVANSITWYQSGGNTIVQIDNTGDTTAESEIQLAGLHTLGSTDFVL